MTMGQAVPAVRTVDGLIVGLSEDDIRRIAASKIYGEINATMRRLLAANDGFGSKVLREAILGGMNDLSRYVKREFVKAGITDASDYYVEPVKDASNDNPKRV